MAQNIAPSLNSNEEEISGLLNWSLPFALAITLLSFFVAFVKMIGLGQSNLFSSPSLMGIWQMLQILAFLWHGLQSFRFFKSAKAYVNSAETQYLGNAMAQLGNIWNAYAFVLFCSLMGAITIVVGKNTAIPVWMGLMLSLSFLLVMFFSIQKERKRSFAGENFKSELPPFAVLSVRRTRSLAFLSLGVGALFIVFFLFDFFQKTPLSTVSTLLCGMGYLLIGIVMGFYWRALREIQRNPSWIYFERTLEKLNLYWLIVACVAFPLIFISNILS